MTTHLTIRALRQDGVPKKTIARRLGIDVRTVRKYIRRLDSGDTVLQRAPVPMKLDPWRDLIEGKVEAGLTAVQIHQDLAELPGFDASYPTVQRHVKSLRRVDPEVFCRMRSRPGEEAQIDFGEIGKLLVDGKPRKAHLFVMTLCFSRMSYHELVLDQTVTSFLGAIRRGFEYFGGVPARLKPDNLRSAVLIDRIGQRYYQEDFFRFCRHYGVVPDAARIHTPTDKGKVERDIGYAKTSCFRGRDLETFEEAQAHLARWREKVANVRLHGTTRRRPMDLFEEERKELRPLPEDPYEACLLGRYKVRKDCHIRVRGNFYSVPHRFVGEFVLVRLGEKALTIFNESEKVAEHALARGEGEDVTDPDHYPATKRLATQEIHRRRTLAVRSAGPHTAQFLSCLREGPWVYGDQLARLSRLVAGFGEEAVELACRRALYFGATSGAKTIESILERGLHTKPLPTDPPPAEPDPDRDYGRPLAEYGALLAGKEVA
jgi:transposase